MPNCDATMFLPVCNRRTIMSKRWWWWWWRC